MLIVPFGDRYDYVCINTNCAAFDRIKLLFFLFVERNGIINASVMTYDTHRLSQLTPNARPKPFNKSEKTFSEPLDYCLVFIIAFSID